MRHRIRKTRDVQAEEARRRSEAYLAEAQRLSHVGSFGWNVATGELIWSDETFRIYDHNRSITPTLDLVLQRTHPDDLYMVQGTIDRALREGNDFDIEHRLLTECGAVRNVHVVAHAMRDATGKLLEFVGAIMDVTARKRAEERLRESEISFHELVELLPLAVYVCGKSGLIQRYNRAAVEMWGRAPATGELGEHYCGSLKLYLPDGTRLLHEHTAMAEALRTGEAYRNIEVIIERPEGSRTMVVANIVPVKNDRGEVISAINCFWDITDLKGKEAALWASERQQRELAVKLEAERARLVEAQAVAKVGSWERDVLTGTLYWSDETYCIFESDRNVFTPTYEGFLEFVHPEDRAKIDAAAKESFDQCGAGAIEYRMRLPDGRIKTIAERWQVHRDDHGQPARLIGTCHDITEQKRRADALQQVQIEREMELQQIIDLAPGFIVVRAPDRRILYVNRNLLESYGLTLAEVQSKNFAEMVVHPDDRERFYIESERGFGGGVSWEMELRLLGKNGQCRWFLSRHNPLYDEMGKINRWLSMETDINDRKQVEERVQNENVVLREEVARTSMFEEIVGNSSVLRAVLSRVSKVAPTDSTVLITGETGTGKELIARAIHKRSKRSSRVFVSVNCAAIPTSLIASELFGHEKGAFTSALQRRLGRFELAEGGTIFLDEIGELPSETQIALLRVLQEREFERVGGTKAIRADVRVIAATNRDLKAVIVTGAFRSDLFYRLNVFPIEMPPLRKHKDDIRLLAEYFVERYARKIGKKICGINTKTLELFRAYDWPGNIRELQNIIERSVIVCETENFSVDESWLSRDSGQASLGNQRLFEKLEAQEKELIEAALLAAKGQISGPLGAAVKLGIPPSTLDSKIRLLKINKHRFKAH